MSWNEFGLGAYEISIMLLTHPERLKYRRDLGIGCVGDEYFERDDSNASNPMFRFTSRFVFDFGWINTPLRQYGSPTAFLSY